LRYGGAAATAASEDQEWDPQDVLPQVRPLSLLSKYFTASVHFTQCSCAASVVHADAAAVRLCRYGFRLISLLFLYMHNVDDELFELSCHHFCP